MVAFSTYVPLVSYTLPSSAASMTITDIPTTYTDLRIVVNALVSMAYAGTYITANFQVGSSNTIDTTASYGATTLYADTSVAGSSRLDGAAGTSVKYTQDVMAQSTNTGARSVNFFDIIDYSNTTTYKSMLIRSNTKQNVTGTNMLRQSTATWRNTGAINTIRYTADGANLYAGSTITIYGIANNTAGAKATGGVISSDSSYFYHSFYATGTFTPSSALTGADVLVVGGGGGASSGDAAGQGGGGAGGYRAFASQSFASGTAYTCTVGAGGTGALYAAAAGSATGSSIAGTGFTTINASAGGAGSSYNGGGSNGGSGGGAGTPGNNAGGSGNSGSFTPAEGFAGGGSFTSGAFYTGGGGGGSSAAGANAVSGSNAGAGGAGTQWYNGNYYAGGGGGGHNQASTITLGGSGVGGNGGVARTIAGTNGVVNTGSGGGGGAGLTGGSGASGIVIIRYAR